MGRRKRNNKSTSSSVELARASIDAAAQPLQPTEQSGQQDTPQTQLPKALLQEDAVADQAAKKTQQIKARLSQLLKEQQQGKETLVKLNAELQAAFNKVRKLAGDLAAAEQDNSISFSFPTLQH